MKALFFIFAILFVMSEGHAANDAMMIQKTGEYSIRMTFDKGRPVEGTNRVKIMIRDSASRPVTEAQVKIDYYMPSLPGRPPMMSYSTAATRAGNGYEAAMNFTMKGEWKVAISVAAADRIESEILLLKSNNHHKCEKIDECVLTVAPGKGGQTHGNK